LIVDSWFLVKKIKTTKIYLSLKTFIRIIIRAFATTVASSGIENENLKIKLEYI